MEVAERLVAVPVRQIGAEQEELQGRQDRGQGEEDQDVRHRRAENEPIGGDDRADGEELAPTEIAPEEDREPRPEAARAAGVEIGILGGAGVAMVGEMAREQPVVGEAGVERETDAADRPVQPRPEGRKGAVHAVMGDDEKPDAEPTLDRGEQRRGEDATRRPAEEEDSVDVQGKPGRDDQRGEAYAAPGLGRGVEPQGMVVACRDGHSVIPSSGVGPRPCFARSSSRSAFTGGA